MLDKFDLVVHRRIKRILCRTHGRCLEPKEIWAHLSAQHKAMKGYLPKKPSFVQSVNDVVKTYAIDTKTKFPRPPKPSDVPLQFEGLKIRNREAACWLRRKLYWGESTHYLPTTVLVAAGRTNLVRSYSSPKALRQDAVHRSRLNGERIEPRSFTTWLRTSGWGGALDGHDTLVCSKVPKLPSRGDEFFSLRLLMLQLFSEAYDLVLKTPESARCLLMTTDPAQPWSHTPMKIFQESKTLSVYVHEAVRVVVSLLRTRDNNRLEPSQVNRTKWDGIRFELPPDILDLVDELYELLTGYSSSPALDQESVQRSTDEEDEVQDSGDDEDGGSDYGYYHSDRESEIGEDEETGDDWGSDEEDDAGADEEDVDSDSEDDETPEEEDLANATSNLDREKGVQLCYKILKALWTRRWSISRTNSHPDPTEMVAILHSIDEKTGIFGEARRSTGTFTHIVTLMRLLFIYEAHKLAKRDEQLAQGEPRFEFGQRVFHHIQQRRPWFTETVESTPFRTVRRLVHISSGIALRSLPIPRITWVKEGQCMLYKNTRIKFDDVRLMLHRSQEVQAGLLKGQLLFGMAPPPSGKLTDDVNHHDLGYNFARPRLNHPEPPHILGGDNENEFSALYDPDSLILMQDGMFEAGAFEEFFGVDADGVPRLKREKAGQFLMAYKQLQMEVMGTVQITTCGPARGTELTAMQTIDTVTAPRSVYVQGEYMYLLRRYSKMSHLLGDSNLTQAVDEWTKQYFLLDFRFIRPLAKHLARLLYADDPRRDEIVYLYDTHLFVNIDRKFKTNDLTLALNLMSSRVLGPLHKLGTNDTRHCMAAWMRWRNPGLMAMIGRGNDAALALPSIVLEDAKRMGHEEKIHRQYGPSTNGMNGGIGEDATVIHRWREIQWHGDLHVVPGNQGPETTLGMAFYTQFKPGAISSEPLPMEPFGSHFTTLNGRASNFGDALQEALGVALETTIERTMDATTRHIADNILDRSIAHHVQSVAEEARESAVSETMERVVETSEQTIERIMCTMVESKLTPALEIAAEQVFTRKVQPLLKSIADLDAKMDRILACLGANEVPPPPPPPPLPAHPRENEPPQPLPYTRSNTSQSTSSKPSGIEPHVGILKQTISPSPYGSPPKLQTGQLPPIPPTPPSAPASGRLLYAPSSYSPSLAPQTLAALTHTNAAKSTFLPSLPPTAIADTSPAFAPTLPSTFTLAVQPPPPTPSLIRAPLPMQVTGDEQRTTSPPIPRKRPGMIEEAPTSAKRPRNVESRTGATNFSASPPATLPSAQLPTISLPRPQSTTSPSQSSSQQRQPP
ncbi:unnamed protein product [Peniophora sp. CBMAI 1063]|nr:unnamed protein product [Peniophora sp. CBMAI 1063]